MPDPTDYAHIVDAEERALTLAVHHKADAIAALALAAEARKARGAETLGICESLDLEDMTRAGYQRALDNRRRELALVRSTRGAR